MVELDFNPQIGEQVEVLGYDGPFTVIDRQPSTTGIPGFVLRLRGIQDGRLLDNVHHLIVSYPAEARVRRELERVLAHCDSWPEDFQEERFDVKSDEMYDGTPRIMVYFHLKPEVIPSVSKARVWNDFYAKLQEKLQPIVDSGTWLQFSAKEGRSALSAAS
jgi:hypothetical protein